MRIKHLTFEIWLNTAEDKTDILEGFRFHKQYGDFFENCERLQRENNLIIQK